MVVPGRGANEEGRRLNEKSRVVPPSDNHESEGVVVAVNVLSECETLLKKFLLVLLMKVYGR